jgi:6-pyruvoyltetrahydropterin/6-carboxytetrahydropterin synthase
MISVTKKLTFDAAHRLYRYEGKCANIHGHHYQVFVTLSTRSLDARKISLDFGVIKRYFQTWLDEKWDHKLILSIDDPLTEYFENLVKNESISGIELPYSMPYNPTAEGMAEYLSLSIFPRILSDNHIVATVHSVEVWENPTSFAKHEVLVR